MKLFNLQNEDEKEQFLKELPEYSMPIWVYSSVDNSHLLLVSWNEIQGDRVEEIIKEQLLKNNEIRNDEIIDDDEPLYDDTEEMEDWELWL